MENPQLVVTGAFCLPRILPNFMQEGESFGIHSNLQNPQFNIIQIPNTPTKILNTEHIQIHKTQIQYLIINSNYTIHDTKYKERALEYIQIY